VTQRVSAGTLQVIKFQRKKLMLNKEIKAVGSEEILTKYTSKLWGERRIFQR
jgi:hypothetical protein